MAEQTACIGVSSKDESYSLSMTIYLVLCLMYTNCKHKLGSEHATTQHTVNVVTHVPQRPVNKIRCNNLFHSQVYAHEIILSKPEAVVHRKESLN